MDISLIVCTYNRAERLKRCLASIANLDFKDRSGASLQLQTEVLIVDNASTDNTREVVDSSTGITNLKYLFEATQGKSYALNLALKESKGRVLIFTDDDIQLDPKAVMAFWAAYQTHKDQFAWFGGRVSLDWKSTEKPNWLSDDIRSVLDGALGIHDLGETSRAYSADDKHPIGALLMMTSEMADKAGEFRTDLGPSGGARGASDDTEYLIRAQSQNFQGHYVGEAQGLHYVEPSRLTLKGFYTYGYAKGANAVRAKLSEVGSFSWRRVLNQAARGLWQLIKGRSDNLRVCLLNIGFEFGKRNADS